MAATMWDIKKVLISDEVDDLCLEVLNSNGIEGVKKTKLTKDQLKTEIAKYDGLIVRSATKVTADVIEAGTRLKVIGRAGTGVDNIDVSAATRRGILVMNTPGGNTLSAAEHTCTMLMAVSRHVSQGTACVRAGQWDQKKFMIGNELYGKTLAIIGLGRIGREVAHRMQSFGMKTVGFDPMVSAEESQKAGIEWLSLGEIWPKADYITLHTPLIPQTKNLINSETLAKCKKGVRIVNCARGGIINENDLLSALNSGICSGAGLDVFEQEPPANTKLIQHPLVTSTPHLGASTVEAQTKVAVEIAQNIVDFAQQTAITGAINGSSLSLIMSPDFRPWFQLATSLARLARTLLGGTKAQISSINIDTRGNMLKSANSSLAAASVVGLFEGALPLNLISAPAIAKSNGIEIKTAHYEKDDEESVASSVTIALTVTTLSQVEAQSDGGQQRFQSPNSVTLTGTVRDGQLRWTAVDEALFSRQVPLTGTLLVCRCCKTSKPNSCLSVVNDYLSAAAEGRQEFNILSFTAASAPNALINWGSFELSQPIENVPASLGCSTLVQISF